MGVPVYFEAAVAVVSLTLLGQMLELKARARTTDALRTAQSCTANGSSVGGQWRTRGSSGLDNTARRTTASIWMSSGVDKAVTPSRWEFTTSGSLRTLILTRPGSIGNVLINLFHIGQLFLLSAPPPHGHAWRPITSGTMAALALFAELRDIMGHGKQTSLSYLVRGQWIAHRLG